MISEILHTTGNYADWEVSVFEKAVKIIQIQKGETILHEGEVARSLYYLIQGEAYQFRSDEDALHVIDLHTQGTWFFNYSSFVSQEPSRLSIAAYSDSTVLELSLEAVHYLIGKSNSFLQLNNVMIAPATRLNFFDAALTPLEKYNFVMGNTPDLVQAFPLKFIASYLKIAPETLSRVRLQWAREARGS
ncbi:Crp/Fnr family transcriptional regulator [Flavobacterium beibuense]|uniref:Putative transcriptional regulator, Crp/Fnr family n=1 Tax=Flavobacterium beibuense TaxID=657326 RepID=A0A444WGG8_9FLAO|nr:Crp/Fnr family transcriptional regulator [Flavobacterium beibuense]RYJ44887.1 putative transcriptional regulator, Crp/Fnr family [Flavobacterium beibuense]